MSATPVDCLMVVDLTLPHSKIFKICHSIGLWVDCSLVSKYLVDDVVSDSYIIVGKTH